MQNKLQELTDKLYNEGLSKGKQEAEDLVAKAKAQAAQIVAKAEEEASAILTKATKDAESLKSMAAGDVQMATKQSIAAVKQQVEQIVISKLVNAPVEKSFSDADFVKGLILTVVKAFDASNPESVGLDVILPESMKDTLGKSLAGEVSGVLSKGVDVSFMKGLANGFKIGPKDGGFVLNFTADEFSGLIGEYLRPATKKILFSK